jgi:hypothetical protein
METNQIKPCSLRLLWAFIFRLVQASLQRLKTKKPWLKAKA